MERRHMLGAALAALSMPAAARVVCLPVQVPLSPKPGLLVSYPVSPFAIWTTVKLDGVVQGACIMAMGGEQGFVVCYSRDGEDLVFVDQVGSKLEVKYGKVELEMPAEAPEWAHQAFVYAQENWA